MELNFFILDFIWEMELNFFILDCERVKIFICDLRDLRFVLDKIIDVRAVFETTGRVGTRILERSGLNLKCSTEQFVFPKQIVCKKIYIY